MNHSALAKMEQLIKVLEELSMARDMQTIQNIVKHAARSLVGSDGCTFVLRERGLCYYADEDAISPLWKGQRFKMDSCVSGWVMLNKQTAVIEDIYQDPRIPIDAYSPTFVKSLVMVPIRTLDPIGAIGTYWQKKYCPTTEEIKLLEALANSTSIAIENVTVYSELEQRVKERTAQLNTLNTELEAFTYSVSHDLRSPITIISGFSQMIQLDKNNNISAESQNLFTRIDYNLKRMNALIDDLLRLSRIAQATVCRQDIDISAMANEIITEFQNNNPLRIIEYSIEPEIKMQGDGKLIRIALENILANALKYSAKKEKTLITIGRYTKDAHHGVFIKDNGVGFRMPDEGELFRPFKRYHNHDDFPGSGIGMAIVTRIIRLHNGAVWAESAPNQGACFYFYVE